MNFCETTSTGIRKGTFFSTIRTIVIIGILNIVDKRKEDSKDLFLKKASK